MTTRRPSGIPKRIPAWAWKWLRWRTRHKPKPPTPGPVPTPTPPKPPKPPKPPAPKLPLQGCDYVSGPTPAQLKAAGIHFVCRYLSTPGNPKNLTKTEATALHKAGISIVLVFETTANRALSGKTAGEEDARSAHRQAQALGAPASIPIYFAVDFDATTTQQAAINNYFRGAADVLGKDRVGIYGGFYPVSRTIAAGVCTYAWQAYAWSGGQWHVGNHIEQYQNGAHIAGHSVDLDRAKKAAYGQWAP